MSKVEEKKKNKQEALLASAFKLFTEKGINNTSRWLREHFIFILKISMI